MQWYRVKHKFRRGAHAAHLWAAMGWLWIPIAIAALSGCDRQPKIVVGCKNFTEQIILGELIAQQIENRTRLPVERRFYLAGTYIAQQSILAGRIDIYPEYTGTALTAILKQPAQADKQAVYEKVKSEYERRFQLTLGPPFGFNDTFAIQIRGETARRLHLRTLSEAATYAPKWRAGFGYEFMERPDGYKGLVATYGLRFAAPPRIMDLGLLTRALRDGQVDLIAGNMTDGLIPALDLFVLEDDKHYFPPYEAVPVVRQQTLAEHPELKEVLDQLGGTISDQDMRELNYAVDGKKRQVKEVVRDFLARARSHPVSHACANPGPDLHTISLIFDWRGRDSARFLFAPCPASFARHSTDELKSIF